MADIASLGLAVDSSQADKGTLSLDKLSNAAKRAEAANNGLAVSSKNASAAAVAAARSAYQESVAKTAAARAAENASRADVQAAMAAQRKAKEALEVAKADHARVAASNAAATAAARDASAALKAAAALDAEAAAAQKAAAAMNVHARAANDNVVMAGKFNTANLAAQFQDIAVSAQMGMGALQIGLQQGTQVAAVLATMEKPVQGLAQAFMSVLSPVSLVTIGLISLAAAGLQFIDWTKVGAAALNGLAWAIENLTPYLLGLAATMALIYAPAIISGIGAVTLALGGLAVAAMRAAASFTLGWLAAIGPAGWFLLGLAAIVTAAVEFRDELTQIFGFDIVGAVKSGINTIIAVFHGGYEGIVAAWDMLPAAFSDIGAKAGYMFADKLREWINEAILLVDTFIKGVNEKFGTSIARPSVLAPLKPPASSGAAADVGQVISDAIAKRQGTDYLGAIASGASAAADKIRDLAGSFANAEDAAGKAGKAAKGAADGAKDPWDGLRNAVDRTKEAMSFARDLAGGFLSDLRSGLKQGEGFWSSFKNAALNALDKIVDKLLNNVLDALFQVNSAGSGIGGGGGGIGGLLGGIFSIFGFAGGGYTGRGGASHVAGVVHGGEYVFSKRATDRIGVNALEQLHQNAKGYARGGYVTPSVPRVQAPANGNGSPREVVVRVVGEAGPMFIPTIQAESKDVAVQVTQAGIGQYDKQLNRTLGGKIANAQSRQL